MYSGSMLTRLDALTDKYPDSVSLLTESRPACSGLFNLIHGVTLIVMKMAGVIIDFYGLYFTVNDMNCKDFSADLIYNSERMTAKPDCGLDLQ